MDILHVNFNSPFLPLPLASLCSSEIPLSNEKLLYMMEALAAISLAGNIVQFIDTARTLITTARQLRASGSTTEHRELALLARELRGLVQRATRDAEAPTPGVLSANGTDEPLRLLVTQCEDVAKEILSLLKDVDVGDDAGKLETALAVLRSNRKKDEIQAVQGRLDRISHAVDLHLGFYDRRRVLARIDELAAENRRLEAHRAEEIRQLKSEFVDSFERLAMDRRRAKTLLFDASGKALQFSAEQAILDELHFHGIGQREASVYTAHRQTLAWVFGKPEQSSPASFEEWLSSDDDDLYWISGKPGSGKSTLMKFLTHHPQTEVALNSWARGHALIRAEYFFWATSGAGLHKSQQGLLQSIVYRILRDRPELIAKVYRDAFGGAKVLSRKGGMMPEISTSVTALLDALQAISLELLGSDARFCFFIDGLDEYDGKPLEIIELIGHLRTLPHVKICISSRPWNEFEQAFGSDGAKKLYMQDFNRVDISAYIDHTFTMDRTFQELEPEDKTVHGDALIKEIAEAANGVFLWVYLVVRSFQEGLLNGDRLIDLRRRLVLLPTDLNSFYSRILTVHVHEFYREQSAVLFAVTEEAFSPLPLMAYWYIGEETAERVDSQEYVWKLEARPLSAARIEKRLSDMRRRLSACCKGLLEVQDSSDPSPAKAYFESKVVFLHRTVRDFLRRPSSKALMHDWRSSRFETHETIARALVAQIMTAPREDRRGSVWDEPAGIMLQATAKLHVGACNGVRGLETLLDEAIRAQVLGLFISPSPCSMGSPPGASPAVELMTSQQQGRVVEPDPDPDQNCPTLPVHTHIVDTPSIAPQPLGRSSSKVKNRILDNRLTRLIKMALPR